MCPCVHHVCPRVPGYRSPVRLRWGLVLFACPFSLAACSGTSPPRPTQVGTSSSLAVTPSSTTSEVPTTSVTPPTTSLTHVLLEPDGLGVVSAGEPQSLAVSTLTKYLGTPTGTTAGDCTGTTEVEWSDLVVEFDQGVLSGYRYLKGGWAQLGNTNPPPPTASPVLKAATGATLGMTQEQVRGLYPSSDYSTEEGGAVLVSGTYKYDRLSLLFFSPEASTPLMEIKGGGTCGDF